MNDASVQDGETAATMATNEERFVERNSEEKRRELPIGFRGEEEVPRVVRSGGAAASNTTKCDDIASGRLACWQLMC